MRTPTMKRTIALWLSIIALLLVLPTAFADLVIQPDSVRVNGQIVNTASDIVNVTPGDLITIQFNFQNTFTTTDGTTLGHIVNTIESTVDGLTGLPAESDETWILAPQESGSAEFSFSVPLGFDPTVTEFDVIVNTMYDGFNGDFSDMFRLSFAVVREDIAIEIVDGTSNVPASSISCTGTTATLRFDIINTGSEPYTADFAPELKVYNQAASGSSFNRQTGEFTFATAPTISFEETLGPLMPGQRRTEEVSIDISRLSAGTHRFYFYLINPYFSQEAFFIGDQDSAAFTTTSCASSFSPTSASISVLQNVAATFSVTLADASLESSVIWTVSRAGTEVSRATGIDRYTFNQATAGTYSVRVTIGAESKTWTVTVSAPAPAALSISPISIENVRAGQAANATITVTNTGANVNIGSFTAVLEGVNARYQARIVGTLPSTLAAGASSTALRLELTVPTDEATGAHAIGNLVVRGLDAAGTAVSTTQAISLNPQSFLTIESVKLNGKAAGDLTLDEVNEFDVKIKNTYTQDINDITVTVTILDVDGEDIEKESESFDLGDGKDDTITVS